MRMDEDFLRYSALDSACTMEIKQKFWEGLSPLFMPAYEMTVRLLPVLMFLQTRGMVVNKKALEETKREVLASAAEKQKELDSLCGFPLNVNSPKQCQEYFYGRLGIPPYKNKDGNPTVDDLALQRLVRGTASRPGLRTAKLVQEIRSLHKLHGTYLDLEFDPDGRIRCSYNPRGTKFGRLSSSETIFGTGTNMQNLPQEFKKFLEADSGYVLVECDKRQAEWVVVAYCTGDANMIAAIEGGVDVHTYTACQMFNVQPEIVKREAKLAGHSTDGELIYSARMNDLDISKAMRDCGRQWPRSMSLRQCGKKSNHGLNYDEGYKGFAMINEMAEDDAKRVVDFYHAIYPGIKIWYESIKRILSTNNRILTNCFGRSVRFLGGWADDLFKAAYSMLPQSTVVDSLNQGMVALYDDNEFCGVDGLNVDLLAQVHDSILMQIPVQNLINNFDYFINRVRDATSPDITYNGRTFKIATDFKFGLNWGEHSDTNPGGMQEFDTLEGLLNALKEWEKIRDAGALGRVA